MSDLLGTAKLKKVFRGAYNYYRDGQIYSEETFEVFKDTKELNIIFQSQILSRVSTGELLKIETEYTVNKDWIPVKVQVSKFLGRESVEEHYKLDVKSNLLVYNLKSKHTKDKQTMSTPPRFHIATPTTASSMLFFLSKKFDATTRNFYTVISSKNRWTNEHPLEIKTYSVEKLSLTAEAMMVNGMEVQALKYRIMEDVKEEPQGKGKARAKEAEIVRPPQLVVGLSRHYSIPYRVEADEQNKIEIKFLNNLQEEDDKTAQKVT
jgi:hypothetical protein